MYATRPGHDGKRLFLSGSTLATRLEKRLDEDLPLCGVVYNSTFCGGVLLRGRWGRQEPPLSLGRLPIFWFSLYVAGFQGLSPGHQDLPTLYLIFVKTANVHFAGELSRKPTFLGRLLVAQ